MIIPFLFCCLAVRHQLSVAPVGGCRSAVDVIAASLLRLPPRPRRTLATRATMTMARLPGDELRSRPSGPAVARSPLVPESLPTTADVRFYLAHGAALICLRGLVNAPSCAAKQSRGFTPTRETLTRHIKDGNLRDRQYH